MTRMPVLTTARLHVRPFVLEDLEALHQILDVELANVDFGTEGAQGLQEREQWLRWAVLNYDQLALMYQPPYGDRAIVVQATGELIGACGFVPAMGPFAQLPGFAPAEQVSALHTPEIGLYYAISPRHQRQGYAKEAVEAMIDYAFEQLRLKRIVITTTYDNAASIAVMRALGMQVVGNPYADPPWFQVVGYRDNPEH